MVRREITFHSSGETLAGEVLLPAGAGPHPAVLLVGGTISDTRDGDPAASLRPFDFAQGNLRPGFVPRLNPRGQALHNKMPRHGMFKITAERLAQAGFASLRWDKRGVGASTGPDRNLHSDVWTDVDDAEQALLTLSQVSEVDPARLVVLGESAGGYFVCFLAARTNLPAGYVLQAALYTSIPEMLAFNYQRVIDYAARGPAEAAWIQRVAPSTLRVGRHWWGMVEAAGQGAEVYESEDAAGLFQAQVRRLKQELAYPPAERFRLVQKPVLVVQGDRDLNVPPGDCHKIAAALRTAGNEAVTLAVVPGADHSMQQSPADEETRLRERISLASFQRPYVEAFFTELTAWLSQHFLKS